MSSDTPRTDALLEACKGFDNREVLVDGIRILERELTTLREQVNRPEIENFLQGAILEAAHQKARWGNDHDKLKTPEDWLWLVAYLTTKATQAARYGDEAKFRHHLVTGAAVFANWHATVGPLPGTEKI